MDNREVYSALQAVPPVFIRLDGRAFHALTNRLGFEKPFDRRFCSAMCRTAQRLVSSSGLSPLFAYTFSDEISLFLPVLPFSGRVEKMDSVAASFAASCLTLELGLDDPVAFDARVILASPEYALEYLAERQAEAWRNHINAYCQQALIREGMSAERAAAHLKNLPSPALHEMMHERGVNLAKTPSWQRRGVLVRKERVQVAGYNPIEKIATIAERSRVVPDRNLPLFSTPEGREFLLDLMKNRE
ncbi:MAG: tRNA(His) guanylyltransferase Thg1 family protein [Methanoregulaceae archaeon]